MIERKTKIVIMDLTSPQIIIIYAVSELIIWAFEELVWQYIT